ncbi:protease Do [Rhodomicrobium vannielii ATCC 17100]|uniref:Probable periplasmic serine endoprotease DegP-like n=1 Tax=Rhodomicrobium vannielii (strain ATCC 17100 / DSM 162 / LMG 4299 / NCIMB 10020 / ATH 3.1.1) TaxID=648757 RepID=E3I0Y0_RHOVT|nr:Do family serine endopeptidase [Rhodomicrobium vannielii]ADP72303.1 protease Do [Rhodomicrobium vannielii ATCC 17100]
MAAGQLEDEPRDKRAFGRVKSASAFLGAGLLGVGLLAATPAMPFHAGDAFAQEMKQGPLPGSPPTFADLADKVRPAVVSVNVKSRGAAGETAQKDLPDLPQDHPLREFFDQFKHNQPERRPSRAQGSGFLISPDGYVVTNHHVADKVDEIEITFENEEKYKAKVVGSDARTDIALLKIDSKKKFDNWLEFEDAAPRVGDWVLAVGNPFGLGGTVTAGIVSANGRDIGSGPYDFLQIDAAVNRGNSGGPAVDLKGKVVGVNTAIYSPSGGSVGIAFAIPTSTAKEVVDKLRDKGKVSSGWLGVQIQNLDENIAESQGLKTAKGALVAKIIADGPAAKSELKARDVIQQVNGRTVGNSRELARTIAALPPGADAKLRVFRNGEEREVTVKLGEFPANDKLASLQGGGNDDSDSSASGKELEDLGLTLIPAPEFPGAKTKEGVAIVNVDPNSKAADQGLRRGDVIVEVNGKTVTSPDEVVEGIRDARQKNKKNVLLQVRSRDQQRFIGLPIDKSDEDKESEAKEPTGTEKNKGKR